MKIAGTGETFRGDELYDCRLYIRQDLTVIEATEYYYTYVGDNSYLPLSELLYPEDGEELRRAVSANERLELITGITNLRQDFRTIYLRMEPSGRTENGGPLFEVTLFDIRDMEGRNAFLEQNVAKYRYFMGLSGQYYFEYTETDNLLIIYKYINNRAVQVVEKDLDLFAGEQNRLDGQNEMGAEQMRVFCQYLKARTPSFEMEFKEEKKVSYKVKGGRLPKNNTVMAGIIQAERENSRESYYLTPAARDSGTGLLNKKASVEYTVERLQLNDNKCRWFVMMDVDDFKNINDSFGHLFGDEVISKVAEVLQECLRNRGIAGRFGGDEFFMLLEGFESRDEVRNLLKTIVKHLYYVYEPKYKITCSIGLSQYPKDGVEYEELMEKADKALYIAKEKGKNRHVIYDEKLHGKLDNGSGRVGAAAFSVSREKRRAAIIEFITGMYANGTHYLEQEKVLKLLRQVFDLDGITVFSGEGRRVVCRSGNYVAETPDAWKTLHDDKYTGLFDEAGMLVESNMLKLKAAHPLAYEEAVRQEIGASVGCMGRKDGKPYSLIMFDVFNCSRKWSDADVEMLGLIGNCMNQLLCEE